MGEGDRLSALFVSMLIGSGRQLPVHGWVALSWATFLPGGEDRSDHLIVAIRGHINEGMLVSTGCGGSVMTCWKLFYR